MVLKPLGLLAATLIAAPVAATEATAVARKQALMQQYVAAQEDAVQAMVKEQLGDHPTQYRTRRTCSEQTAKFFGLNTSVDPVDGQRTSTEYLVGKYSGMFEPVDCHDWKAFVFCINGDCQLAFNSGRYGLHPTACSKARIDGQVFRWCGKKPDYIGRQMWSALRDGSEIAVNLTLWPTGWRRFVLKPDDVSVIKARVARGSY